MEKKVWLARFACAAALGLLCSGASGGTIDLNVPTDYSSGGFYRYCPATLVEGGVRHVFYCKNTTANQIVDSIYHATVDAAGNLSGESAVLDPADSTGTAWDSYHVCDPSVIKGAFVYNDHTYTYLMAYLGVQGRVGDTESDGYRAINNKVGLALSDSLDSGWVRMGTNAVVVTDMSGTWGVGQPSLVSLDKAGKVALFYAGDYGTCMLALDFTDAAKTTASLTQKVGSEGSPVSKDGVSDLAGTTTKMTITNADFAYNPSTGRLYMIADTPDRADSWYDGGGQNLYITKAVTVYGCTLSALTTNAVTGAIWHQQMRIQPADLDGSTLATTARVTNSGLVRTPYGEIAEKTAMVTVANVVPNALYTYRFMPVDWSVNEATDDPYIQSVTRNSFINTGYIPNPTTRLELDYALCDVNLESDDGGTVQTRLMGNGGTGSTLPMILYIGGKVSESNYSVAFCFGDRSDGTFDGQFTRWVGTTDARAPYVDEVRRTAIIDNPNKKVALLQDGVKLWEHVKSSYTFNNTSKSPLGLFGDPKTSSALEVTNPSKLRVYGLKIYESNVLVHDFVPYLQAGWPGLRDTMTGLFVSDDRGNSAAFKYGGDIEVGDDPYIASSGTCAVNLRHHFGPKTKYELDFAVPEDAEKNTTIMGTWQTKGSRLYLQNNDTKTLAVAYGDTWTVYFNTQMAAGTRRRTCVVDALNTNVFYRTGATTNLSTALPIMTKTSDQPLALFGTADANSGTKGATFSMLSKAKVYSCKIWEDGELVHDYKPCVKGGVAGFKDTVDGAFVEGESKTAEDRLTYGGPVMVEPDDGYIEVAGEDCVFDTGYICSSKTRIEADFAFTTNAKNGDIVNGRTLSDSPTLFGVWDGEAVNFTLYNNTGRKYGWSAQTNSVDWTDTGVPTTLSRRTVVLDAANATRVLMTAGYTNKTASMKMATTFVKGTSTLPLFTRKRKGALEPACYPYAKLYGFRIYEDGVLKKNLVPCLKDGVPGLFDAASETGDFLTVATPPYALKYGGNLVSKGAEEGAYIEADGTQAINTGYYVNSRTRVEVDFRGLHGTSDGSKLFCSEQIGENQCSGPYWYDDKYGTGKFRMGLYGSTWAVATVGNRDMQRHTAILDVAAHNFKFVTGTATNTVPVPNGYSSATAASYPLTLLGSITNNVITRGVKARVYAFRIYEGDTLLHHYLPYSDGETVGFCDVAAEGKPIMTKVGGHQLTIGGCGWGEENAAFYTAPKDFSLSPGKTKRMEAFAPGAVAYQWYCDGEPIEGATGQTFDVSWSKSKEPAVYTVRATFSRFGVPFTRDASATVTSRPKGLTLTLR